MALVELARFTTRTEGEVARLGLESHGIVAILFDAEMSGIGWGAMMPVRLMVLEEERAEAERVLREG